MTKTKFSIIIPLKEFNDYLEESIPNILSMDYKNFEIIILTNEKPSKIPNYLKNKKIKIIETGKVSPAIKRDIGAKNSKGEYLAFLDDDAYPEKNWLNIAEQIFEEKKVAVIGGAAITPETDSTTQKASGLFFETLFGGGGLSYRYKPNKKSFYVDDFPTVNFIVSKKAFFDIGGFDNEFWPGEDTKFCRELIKQNYPIWYSNELIVYHHRRKLFLPHLKQIANYGKHRGYFAKKFPENSRKLTYFMPSIFLIGNAILFILIFFNSNFFKLWVLLMGTYFSLITIDVFVRTLNIKIGILTIITILLSHLTYGWKFIEGFLSKKIRSELR
jgi:GT2 family glycosyltransferase